MTTSHNPYAPTQKAPEARVEAVEPEETQEETVETEEPETEPEGVPEGSAAEVLEWVGEDKNRAQQALEAEDAGQQRIGLSRKLKDLAE